jgi:hypothetical protein
MNLKQLAEDIGLDRRAFLVFDGDDDSSEVGVLYPNYMETVDFSTKPRELIAVLKDMEDMAVAHRKDVNQDIKLIRKKIKELEN